MADLEVSAKFVLEGAKDLAGQLEQAGRAGGQVFGESLSTEAQKRLDGIVNQAEAAAKRVGLAFNKTKLRFEDASGQVVPDDVFNRLAKLDKGRGTRTAPSGSSPRRLRPPPRTPGGASASWRPPLRASPSP